MHKLEMFYTKGNKVDVSYHKKWSEAFNVGETWMKDSGSMSQSYRIGKITDAQYIRETDEDSKDVQPHKEKKRRA